ncbi:MAG TPA: pilus assembly protein TadG-related protein [Candidatus Limnocylindrales bacterium]
MKPSLPGRSRRPQSNDVGQALVIFALALVALIAMTGLVLDGGSTFVQRREQQNVADAAAMAGAYAYLENDNPYDALVAAQSVAIDNGYPNGGGTSITVAVNPGAEYTTVVVGVTKSHQNYFSGAVGMSSWPVTTTATALASGGPNAAFGAMPIIFNKKAIDSNGSGSDNEVAYDEPGGGPEDVPQSSGQFNWTVFCTHTGNPCNADSRDVRDLINSRGTTTWVYLDEDIGPLNAGSHTTLFSDLVAMVGSEFPVAIVDNEGKFLGWAMFHLTGSVGGSTKQISGFFVSPINPENLHVVQGHGSGDTGLGTYSVYLIN